VLGLPKITKRGNSGAVNVSKQDALQLVEIVKNLLTQTPLVMMFNEVNVI